MREKDLVSFTVVVKETDLLIHASSNLKRKALKAIMKYRRILESYIEKNPDFLTSLKPLPLRDGEPLIIKAMIEATAKAGVGPMASVAGAIAEFVGKELLEFSPQVIVENGGDIYLKSTEKRVIGIYAGSSPLSGKIGLEIDGRDTPLGICTSSGTVGHSLSYGRADAVVVLSPSTPLADACATAIGNLIKQPQDIEEALKFAQKIDGLRGVLIIVGDELGAWGEVNLCPIQTLVLEDLK